MSKTMRAVLLSTICFLFSFSGPIASSRLVTLAEGEIEELVTIYKHLHSHPELSYHESETAAVIADALHELGFTVTTGVGKYQREGLVSHGVVGVLQNGPGKVVMVRADMDALPVKENTGLPYASQVRIRTENGVESGVMHACGHDMHMTCLLGTAQVLVRLKKKWSGTLVMIAQPAEERGSGAKAMLDDGLYERFPQPDYALALHVSPTLTAGRVGWRSGYALANVDSVDITVRGMGGHGAYPHATKDPIVLAAQIILALQTISSRVISPLDPVVVTVGSIHGGTKHNIIPDEVHLQLTIRSYKPDVRSQVLASIRRICRNTAGIPEDLLPIVTLENAEFTPSTFNDPTLTERMVSVFEEELGGDQVFEVDSVMAGEDFSRYSLEPRQIPSMIFWLGTLDPRKAEKYKSEGKPLPPLHSSMFAPSPRPTIETGVRAMAAGVLELMGGPN
jgi:hippurate hydrolase